MASTCGDELGGTAPALPGPVQGMVIGGLVPLLVVVCAKLYGSYRATIFFAYVTGFRPALCHGVASAMP